MTPVTDGRHAYAAAACIHVYAARDSERLATSRLRHRKRRAASEEHERALRQWAWATMWLLLWALEET